MTRNVAALLSAVSLAACLATPVLYFWGTIDERTFKQILAVASLGWFLSATTWATRRREKVQPTRAMSSAPPK